MFLLSDILWNQEDLMQIQMIALDVDGTLIDDHFQIQPKTKEILKQAYQDGIVIALCTGRSPDSTLPLMEELGAEGPIAVHNGALCLHSKTKQIYGQVGFRIEELAPLIEYCRNRKIHMDINTAFDLYVEQISPEVEELYQHFYINPIKIANVMEIEDEVVKMSMLAKEEVIESCIIEIQQLFPQYHAIRSGETYIDVIHPRANKGYGMAIVADKLGIPLQNVIAFGNYYNDLELLQEVGLGIAMENSPDEVKRAAKAVTRSNNDEGIYYALKKYLYSE